MKQKILTGDRPSGKLHLGHYAGSLENRVRLQETHDQFVMIADIQALTDNFEDPKKITDSVMEVAKDYLAVGLDPEKTTIFIQSQIPELTELTVYYLNLVTLGRLERNPTVKTEIQQKGFGDSIPAGFFCYPVSQAADITLFSADLVPVGHDQIPMIEQTNEIVRRFNRIYGGDCLRECAVLLSQAPRLVGIDGKAKASKSLGNAIYLSDTEADIKKKVFQMYTDPGHLKISDPGQVEGNAVFAYLEAFHRDRDELDELKSHYKRGGLGDGTIKGILLKTLGDLLGPIRERRMALGESDVLDILREGTRRAQSAGKTKMAEIRDAMGIGYF
jgi:tryptophanyl-tRNA synthetase